MRMSSIIKLPLFSSVAAQVGGHSVCSTNNNQSVTSYFRMKTYYTAYMLLGIVHMSETIDHDLCI
jgi:hypothetical protein